MVNVMGEHALRHLVYDSPLRGDTDGISRSVSHWTRTSLASDRVAADGAEAIRVARGQNGQIATLILPADAAWGEGAAPVAAGAPLPLALPDPRAVAAAIAALGRPGAALLVGGQAAFGADQVKAAQICAATGARLMTPLFNARSRRGAGAPVVEILPYAVELTSQVFADVRELVLLGAQRPVNFFAYPGKPSVPDVPGTPILELATPQMDLTATLDAMMEALNLSSDAPYPVQPKGVAAPAPGPLTPETAGQAIAAWLPDEAVVVNEAVTAAAPVMAALTHARPHDFLMNTGGAIGQCLPMAVGAAIGAPDRPVVALTGDGSAMYTIQSLWTMAREQLDVTVIVYANRGYQILRHELAALGVSDVGRNARRMFDIDDPMLDFVAMAQGHGMSGERVADVASLEAALQRASATKGPSLIELAV